jgi:hypothetical protein
MEADRGGAGISPAEAPVDLPAPVPGPDDCDGTPDGWFSWRPQLSQNSAASGNTELQNGQFGKSQNPQRLQNLASPRFSELQF